MLAETFLNKRYQAGKDVGEEIGEARGIARGEARGIARGEAQKEAELLKFLEEHPEATAEEMREFLSQSSRNGRNGKSE